MTDKIKGHVHAELMAEYAEVAKTNPEPWKEFQYFGKHIDIIWCDLDESPRWEPNVKYRRKPKTIRIGEYDVPESLRVKPEYGATYYTIFFDDSYYNEITWLDDEVDEFNYKHGLAYAAKEAAILHTKAILSLTKKVTEND